MITLYAFGPQFSLPDPSPFVTKAEVLLKMSKLPYEIDLKGFRKAPKGKLPYIKDDGELIADSTFIRRHLERKHKIDFDRGLSAEQKAIAWAFEKLAEDNLYWAIVDARWMIDANFDKGPRRFFDVIPAPVRPLVVPMIRRQVRKNLHAHGMGRHSRSEIESIATQGIDHTAQAWLRFVNPHGAVIARGVKPFYLICMQAERVDILSPHLFADLDVRAVERSNGQSAVHGEFHVAGSRSLEAGR